MARPDPPAQSRGQARRAEAARRARNANRRVWYAVGAVVAAAAVVIGITLAVVLGGGGGSALPPVEGPATTSIDVVGTEFKFAPDKFAVVAGNVPITLRNQGQVIHDFRVEGIPSVLVEAEAGKTGTGTFQLSPGRYTVYCSIPGHREAGMVAELEVRESGG